MFVFNRYQDMEEKRQKQEHEFQMQRLKFEKDMRQEERQHEINMMSMMMGFQNYPQNHQYPTSSNDQSDQSTYFEL